MEHSLVFLLCTHIGHRKCVRSYLSGGFGFGVLLPPHVRISSQRPAPCVYRSSLLASTPAALAVLRCPQYITRQLRPIASIWRLRLLARMPA